ncbi:hypothetical protein PAAG_08056 [Paracoccidioides lutzii Pb01]|uniref:Uncharacterized protein n=1 Tax=Paracoccidioides lutzii (strain ATCC MYA-826 / Pb01) TaxID=502779 RepID=C1HBB5_PARBA|nr:hypothetical protein PAAG_08056 [Paracoccidioides lutzii Pb01]EEH37638.2 hypothetical protein PAAG_08056 [Paracoccidioides lutzii Pb01]
MDEPNIPWVVPCHLKREGSSESVFAASSGAAIDSHLLRYSDETGNWRGLAPIPDISLEKLEQRLPGNDKAGFLHFVEADALLGPSEERPTAEEAVTL